MDGRNPAIPTHLYWETKRGEAWGEAWKKVCREVPIVHGRNPLRHHPRNPGVNTRWRRSSSIQVLGNVTKGGGLGALRGGLGRGFGGGLATFEI